MAAILSAYYAEPGGGIALQQQHEAIRRAIRAGDEQKARQAMRQHLDYVARGLAQLVGTGRVVRLVFVDLNSTLVSGPRHVSDRVKRTIANVREGGVEVVLVSSRPPRAMRPFLQQLGLMTPMIACDGALLWNVQAASRLFTRVRCYRTWRPRSWPRVETWAPWPMWRATTNGSPTGWEIWCATASSTTRCPSPTRWATSTRSSERASPSTRSSSICATWVTKGAAAQQVPPTGLRRESDHLRDHSRHPRLHLYRRIEGGHGSAAGPPDADPGRADHGHRGSRQ